MDSIHYAIVDYLHLNQTSEEQIEMRENHFTLTGHDGYRSIAILPNQFVGVRGFDEKNLARYLAHKGIDVIVRNLHHSQRSFETQLQTWEPTGVGSAKLVEFLSTLTSFHINVLEKRILIENLYHPYWLTLHLDPVPAICMGTGYGTGTMLTTPVEIEGQKERLLHTEAQIRAFVGEIKSLGEKSGILIWFQLRDGSVSFDGMAKPFRISLSLRGDSFEGLFDTQRVQGTFEEVSQELLKLIQTCINALRLKKVFQN